MPLNPNLEGLDLEQFRPFVEQAGHDPGSTVDVSDLERAMDLVGQGFGTTVDPSDLDRFTSQFDPDFTFAPPPTVDDGGNQDEFQRQRQIIADRLGISLTPPPSPEEKVDAFADMEQALRSVGLDALVKPLRQAIIDGTITTELELTQFISEQEAFRNRFPQIFQRREQDQPIVPGGDLSDQVNAVLDFEQNLGQLLQRTGLGRVFLRDRSLQELTAEVMADNQSFNEVKGRIGGAFRTVQQASPEMRSFFDEIFAGTDLSGDQALAAFVLDPDVSEAELLEAAETAQVGGIGTQFGFDLDRQQAERFADVTEGQQRATRRAFGQARDLEPLTRETISEGTNLTAEDALNAAFGTNIEAEELLQRRLQGRLAAFEGGGGPAVSQQGVVGLGS